MGTYYAPTFGVGVGEYEEDRSIARFQPLAVLLACTTAVLAAAPSVEQTTTVTLVGAGDIASCSSDLDKVTADVLAQVSGTVFTLGDNVYPDGTATQFQNCYHPT